MKYSRFELLALIVGLVSVSSAVLSTFHSGLLVEELIAQTLLMVVLVGAVHWGRKGGALAAVLAVLAYLALRAPLLFRESFSTDVMGLVLIRALTYSVVGVAGGELCSRVRYLLASLETTSNIDEATRLFNERFIFDMLRSLVMEYERYRTPFSIVTLSLEAPSGARLGPATLRAVGTQVRGDVRLVDDAARLGDGRFLLVLPHTGKAGARVAADRVSQGVKRVLGQAGHVVRADVFGADEDLGVIKDLCGAPATPDVNSERPEAVA